jgi:hypothetical protein
MNDKGPSTSEPSEDVGAETGYRFTYQDSWAATLACSLLESVAEFVEIYCEHHEDVLLKRSDGKYVGVQIKTRQLSGDPWKCKDEEVLSAIGRFVTLDTNFPNHFHKFIFATNHFFYQAKKNGNNLRHVLQQCLPSSEIPRCAKSLLSTLASRTGRTKPAIYSTLRKTECDDSLPKLKDCRKVLRESITRVYQPAQEAVAATIERAAEHLIANVRAASSLRHQDTLPAYLNTLSNGQQIEATNRINGKRFCASSLRVLLETQFNSTATLVPAPGPSYSEAESKTRLEMKLNRGGFSVVSVNLAKDFAASALHRFVEWREKFGEVEALRRYNHLKILVLKDCASAYEDNRSDTDDFGRAMLASLRANLKMIESRNVFECSPEHLEGCAYELTSACKVWWSKPFEL